MVGSYVTTKRRQVEIGKTYGRLKVVRFAGRNVHGNLTWDCVCTCGIKKTVMGSNLLGGTCPSCGCFKTDMLIKRNLTHGKAASREYSAWLGMWRRCSNPKSTDWESYGGRGIGVFPNWEEFINFYADMGDRPSELHTLERLDNDADYGPGNCVWATRKVQGRNKRNVPRFEFNGQLKSVAEWAEDYKIHPETLRNRIRRGWSMVKALTRKPRPIKGVHY